MNPIIRVTKTQPGELSCDHRIKDQPFLPIDHRGLNPSCLNRTVYETMPQASPRFSGILPGTVPAGFRCSPASAGLTYFRDPAPVIWTSILIMQQILHLSTKSYNNV